MKNASAAATRNSQLQLQPSVMNTRARHSLLTEVFVQLPLKFPFQMQIECQLGKGKCGMYEYEGNRRISLRCNEYMNAGSIELNQEYAALPPLHF